MGKYDVAVIGGGLAGLTSSIYLAKAGLSVIVVEKSNRLGGRAASVTKNGAMFNTGVHALYRGGAAEEVLKDLGIPVRGGIVPAKGGLVWNNNFFQLPGSALSLLTTKLFSGTGKLELIRFMTRIGKIDTNQLPPISFRDWAEKEIRDPMIRHLVYAICRTNTFVPYPELLLAAPGVRRLQLVFKPKQVVYVDGGWGQLVDALQKEAVRAGVTIMNHKNVAEIEHDGAVRQIRYADGETLTVPCVVVTASPSEMFKLVQGAEHTSLKEWRDRARPVYAACLDVALRKLPIPDPNRYFTFFLDQPIFISTPSGVSRASEDGSTIVHVVKDIGFGSDNPKTDEKQLERALDLIQPGWQQEVVAKQFLPRMIASNDFDSIDRSGNRCGPSVPEVRGLYAAGDWTGQVEILADAVFASARRASREVLAEMNPSGRQITDGSGRVI